MSVRSSPLRAFHVGNTLTYVSLCCGVAAIAAAAGGHTAAGTALIAAAVLADTFDGRFARLFERTAAQQEFGGQLDSLSDAIAFGIAPALLFGSTESATPWWVAVAAYCCCAITRLAFYNVTRNVSEDFVGLPVPVAALICATSLMFAPDPATLTAIFAATALAMVLPIPIQRPRGLGMAAFVSWPLILIVVSFAW